MQKIKNEDQCVCEKLGDRFYRYVFSTKKPLSVTLFYLLQIINTKNSILFKI